MDNYDLSNLLLLADWAVTRERHPRLMDEQNRRATFSRRSTTISTTEQAEQQLPSTGDEQIPKQRVLAGFDISLASSIPAPLMVDEPVVDEPEDPFAALAAYQPRTFDNNTQQPMESNLGLLGNSNTCKAVLAEPDGNDVHEPPERRFDQPIKKRRKLDGTEAEFLLLPRGITTRSQYAATLVKLTASQKNTGQSPEQSFRDRVKKETEQWIVRPERGSQREYKCGYPNCGLAYIRISYLKKHIFNHIHISTYKCTYPECGDNRYFRDNTSLQKHVDSYHKNKKPYLCTLCNKHLVRWGNYKRHMRNRHKITV